MSSNQIVDVNAFFSHLIRSYSNFNRSAEILASQISSLPPDQIEHRCNDLFAERSKLCHLDNQLIEILHLAGEGLTDNELIAQYRQVFSNATTACDDIKTQLLALQKALKSEPVKH